LGHNDSGYLDVMLENPTNKDIYMIEVKRFSEIKKFTNVKNEKKLKQVFSYGFQEKNTKIISFYAHDFKNSKDYFYNIYTDDILKQSQNAEDFFERWNKSFDETDYISDNPIFNFTQKVKQYANLVKITDEDTKILFSQFLTILRLNSISDKPNAFMKMINLFLCKIGDEISQDKYFKVKDINNVTHEFFGMKFQYIHGIDTPESFMKRMNELYKDGMKRYLNKEVIDYNDEEIELLLNQNNNEELFQIFDDLRLKKNNNFSFIEVFDDETFNENFSVVKDIVDLLHKFQFKYDFKYQFLGDFFEELLNTSLKQEAGQFFTPYPIVDFMIDSLPYYENMINEINTGNPNFIPSVIDYACGAGHFLISSIEKTQHCLELINDKKINLTHEQKKVLDTALVSPYCWVNRDNVVGIEKDYRLAKTTKISTFLNGDGDAEIICGDGINKFNAKDYLNTCLYSTKTRIEKFDYLISNPPYSVDGFMLNFVKNGIEKGDGTFSLLNDINYKDSTIEIYFVERAEQLLKKNGICAIVLPQSILSSDKYERLRVYIADNFKINALVMTSDVTFSGTTTSPVILFLEKVKTHLNYRTMIITSPKYLNPIGKIKHQEVKFLGYEFSSNRNKSGISIKKDSVLRKIAPYVKDFILGKDVTIPVELKELVSIKNIQDIILNKKENYFGDIYPKYTPTKGKKLKEFCQINKWKVDDFEFVPTEYVEISNIEGGKIQGPFKNKTTKRFCKKGDIIVSSLVPSRNKIIIADRDYMLSTAIHVLSFENAKTRDFIFTKIRSDEVIRQMINLLDGFKITYAKINEDNLINNVIIKD
jgi:type I restriction enzyme M protein